MWRPITSTHYDAERRIWSGSKPKDLYSENITLGEVIYDRLLKNPKKVIQIHDATGEKMTCEQLLRYAETLVKHLLELGVRTGDVIGIYAGNSTHMVTVILAAFLCGTPVNPVFPGYAKENVATMYKSTRPKVIFCDVGNHENARQVSEELNLNASVIVVNGAVEGLTNVRDILKSEVKHDICFRFPCAALKGNDAVAILSSSGTTGPPKGVLITHQAVINRSIYALLQSDSVLFCFSAVFWATGFLTLTSSLANACLRIVTDKDYAPEYFLQLVQRYQITHAFVGIGHLSGILLLPDATKVQESLASIVSLQTGGAKIPLVIQEKMHKILSNNPQRPGFGIVYATTELGTALSYNSGYHSERLLGSEGKLMPNIEVRVIGKDGELLGPNEHGEICISTPYPWAGYYRNEEANRRAFVDGWLHTGDIGYFNEQGYLHICSRDADIFKSRGFQIYPQSIEETIATIPGVLEVCVVAIPDAVAAYLTGCAVVRTADANGRNLSGQEIEDTVKSMMASMYHLSGGVYFLDALPKTATGKVSRKQVQAEVLRNAMKEF